MASHADFIEVLPGTRRLYDENGRNLPGDAGLLFTTAPALPADPRLRPAPAWWPLHRRGPRPWLRPAAAATATAAAAQLRPSEPDHSLGLQLRHGRSRLEHGCLCPKHHRLPGCRHCFSHQAARRTWPQRSSCGSYSIFLFLSFFPFPRHLSLYTRTSQY